METHLSEKYNNKANKILWKKKLVYVMSSYAVW